MDADLPDRPRYLSALQRGGWPRLVVPLSWRGFDAVAGLLSPMAPRLPGLLRRPALRARMMPLAYSNARMQARLGPFPQPSFEDAMAAAQGADA